MSEVLLEVASPDVYRRNAFRVTGLPVYATTQDVRRHSNRMKVMEKLSDVAPAGRHALALDPPPEPDAVRDAIQRLRDPERRLIDEFFWFWPERHGNRDDKGLAALDADDAVTAVEIWSKPPVSAMGLHNTAVLAHLRALEAEADHTRVGEADGYWGHAFSLWLRLLDRPAFWTALNTRVRELDDPRLTTGSVRRLKATLPLALLSVNAHLAVQAAQEGDAVTARRQVQIMKVSSGLPDRLVEQALLRALDPTLKRLKTLCETSEREANADPVHAYSPARRLLEQSAGILALIDAVLPAGNRVRDGAHDEVALRLLDCIYPYRTATDDLAVTRRVRRAALDIAAGQAARTRIYDDNLMWIECWFCRGREAHDPAAAEVRMYGNVTRERTYNGTNIRWINRTISVPRCADCQEGERKGGRFRKIVTGTMFALAVVLYLIASAFLSDPDEPTTTLDVVLMVLPIILVIGFRIVAWRIELGMIKQGRIAAKGDVVAQKARSFPPIASAIGQDGWTIGAQPAA